MENPEKQFSEPEPTRRNQESERARETIRISRLFLFAFGLNLVLAGIKIVLALRSDSFAVTAGAIDSITDSVASLAVYAGILLSKRSTRNFPLGLYKIENVLSIVIALFIFLAGYELAKQVFAGSTQLPTITPSTIALLAASTVVIFAFGRYALKLGDQTGSPTLKAEGKHRQADVYGNLVVLLAVSLHYLGLDVSIFGFTIDQCAAAAVLIFILYTGWELLSDGMRVLLDASIDHQTLHTIREIIEREPAVREIKSLIGRNAGRFLFIQCDLALRVRDLEKAHLISDRLEEKVMQALPSVQQVIIHYEPHGARNLRCAFALQNKNETLSDHFGGAPYFALRTYHLETGQTVDQEILANPYQELEKGKGLRVAEWLVGMNIDQIVLRESLERKGPLYVFHDAGVKIQQTSAAAMADISLDQLSK